MLGNKLTTVQWHDFIFSDVSDLKCCRIKCINISVVTTALSLGI